MMCVGGFDRMAKAIYGGEPITLATIGNWLIHLPYESASSPPVRFNHRQVLSALILITSSRINTITWTLFSFVVVALWGDLCVCGCVLWKTAISSSHHCSSRQGTHQAGAARISLSFPQVESLYTLSIFSLSCCVHVCVCSAQQDLRGAARLHDVKALSTIQDAEGGQAAGPPQKPIHPTITRGCTHNHFTAGWFGWMVLFESALSKSIVIPFAAPEINAGTVCVSWSLGGKAEFDVNTWPALFQRIYLLLALQVYSLFFI